MMGPWHYLLHLYSMRNVLSSVLIIFILKGVLEMKKNYHYYYYY